MDFDMLGLDPRLLTALSKQGYTKPTPIQAKAIPHVMNGKDVMGLAQTGTGKTAAFGLPLIDMLMKSGGKPDPKTCRALILAPTRELVKQIADNLRVYSDGTPIRVQTIFGGVGINPQISRIERGTDIVVATPGRLIDLLDRRAITLSQTEFLVLDEADQMLDLGFIHALRKIRPLLPAERQTLLFSATMSKQMGEIADGYLTSPVKVEVSPPGKAADKITQSVHFIDRKKKMDLLIELLEEHREELAIVFSRTKHGADRLAERLERMSFDVAAVHGNRSQGQRERAIKAFKAGEIKVLVATDVAARGLDIPAVRHVYNFDLPNVPENYIHRIGRTARAGADGAAIAFCCSAEMGELRAIEKVMGIRIPVASGEPFAPTEEDRPARNGPGSGRRRGAPGGKPGAGKPRSGEAGFGKPRGPKPEGAKPGKPRRPRRPRAA